MYMYVICACVFVALARNSAVSQGAIRSHLGNFYATCQTNIKINCCKDPKAHRETDKQTDTRMMHVCA